MTLGLINANPVVHAKKERIARTEDFHCDDAVDPLEIYDILLSLSLLLFFLCKFCLVAEKRRKKETNLRILLKFYIRLKLGVF